MSELGPAILLIHHAGAAGERLRGATELEGFADQLAHQELTTPADKTCRDRKLTVRGRLTSAPEKIGMSLNEAGTDYQVTSGNLKPIRSGIWQTVVSLLTPFEPGVTVREMRMNWPDANAPSEDAIGMTLKRCADKAGVRRSDTKPARWWMNN